MDVRSILLSALAVALCHIADAILDEPDEDDGEAFVHFEFDSPILTGGVQHG